MKNLIEIIKTLFSKDEERQEYTSFEEDMFDENVINSSEPDPFECAYDAAARLRAKSVKHMEDEISDLDWMDSPDEETGR